MLAVTPPSSLSPVAQDAENGTAAVERVASGAPLFKTLSRDECESVLLRNSVGRIAFTVHDRVNIVPIHYVYLNGWIYGRTGSAGKLRQILRNRRIAFEVDEHSALFEWKSVVIHGPLYVIQPDTTQLARTVYRTALSVMRRLVPQALTESDPVPFRDQLIRIGVMSMTGRASLPYGGQRQLPGMNDEIVESADADTDLTLRDDVEDAIASLTVIDNADVHVETFDGVVVLSGTVETIRDRQAIESEVLNVPSVSAVVQEIDTTLPLRQAELPSDVAREAIKALRSGSAGTRQSAGQPATGSSQLKAVIEHGWIRLEGVVGTPRERDDVIRRLRAIRGARGVIDRTYIAKTT